MGLELLEGSHSIESCRCSSSATSSSNPLSCDGVFSDDTDTGTGRAEAVVPVGKGSLEEVEAVSSGVGGEDLGVLTRTAPPGRTSSCV